MLKVGDTVKVIGNISSEAIMHSGKIGIVCEIHGKEKGFINVKFKDVTTVHGIWKQEVIVVKSKQSKPTWL